LSTQSPLLERQPTAQSHAVGGAARSGGKKALILGGAGLAIALIVLAVIGYLAFSRGVETMDGSAASSDKNQPTALTARTIICGPGAEERYFSFDARRGTLVLLLDVLADGSSVTLQLYDSKLENLRLENGSQRLSVNSSGHIEQGRARLLIDTDQRVVMKVEASYPKGVRVYRVKLDGDVGLAGGLFGGSGKAPESLSSLLAERDHPITLPAREVLSGGTAKDLYYSLDAGPGELKVTLDVFGEGGHAAVEMFGEDSKELRFDGRGKLSVNSSSHVEQETATVLLDKRQPLLMRITNTYPNDTRAIRVRLNGQIPGIGSGTARDAVTSALGNYFADRDNPTRLTSHEITGRASEKDLYYTFAGGPGKVEVYVEGKGNGASVAVEVFDDAGRKLDLKNARDRLSITSSNQELKGESAEFELDREQDLTIRISFTYPQNLESYKVMLKGAVRIAN
jgi:hypothetical protein